MSWPATKSVARQALLIARCSREVWLRALHQSRPLDKKSGTGAADGSAGGRSRGTGTGESEAGEGIVLTVQQETQQSGDTLSEAGNAAAGNEHVVAGPNGPDAADAGAGADRRGMAGTKQKEDAPPPPAEGPMETGGGGEENAASVETAAPGGKTPNRVADLLAAHVGERGEADGPLRGILADGAPDESDVIDSEGTSAQSTEPVDEAARAKATRPGSGGPESVSSAKEDVPEPSSSGASEEQLEEEEPKKVELKTDPIFREYTYHMQSADTRNWLVNEMVRRAMSAALRAGGTISRGERRHRTVERIWTVNRGPFAHGRSKQQFWMKIRRVEFSWRQDARDTLAEPNLRHAGFRIPEKLPGIIATKVIEKSPGCLSVPELYHTIQRKRQGEPHARVDRIKPAGNWTMPQAEQSPATRVRLDVVHPDEER